MSRYLSLDPSMPDQFINLTSSGGVGYKRFTMFGTTVHGHANHWHFHHTGGGLANMFPALTS